MKDARLLGPDNEYIDCTQLNCTQLNQANSLSRSPAVDLNSLLGASRPTVIAGCDRGLNGLNAQVGLLADEVMTTLTIY